MIRNHGSRTGRSGGHSGGKNGSFFVCVPVKQIVSTIHKNDLGSYEGRWYIRDLIFIWDYSNMDKKQKKERTPITPERYDGSVQNLKTRVRWRVGGGGGEIHDPNVYTR